MKNDVDRYFVEHVSQYQQELYAYAYRLTHNAQDAYDLFQEAITRLIQEPRHLVEALLLRASLRPDLPWSTAPGRL